MSDPGPCFPDVSIWVCWPGLISTSCERFGCARQMLSEGKWKAYSNAGLKVCEPGQKWDCTWNWSMSFSSIRLLSAQLNYLIVASLNVFLNQMRLRPVRVDMSNKEQAELIKYFCLIEIFKIIFLVQTSSCNSK